MGETDLARGGRTRAALGAWLVFEDEAGFSMTPATSRTWPRRGHAPGTRLRGRSRRRLSVAALTCYKPGGRSRLIYRAATDRRTGRRKSFGWRGYRDLLIAAHTQVGGPIVDSAKSSTIRNWPTASWLKPDSLFARPTMTTPRL